MAYEVAPQAGMVTLLDTETNQQHNYFPIDAVAIMRHHAGRYQYVENGSVEAGKLNKGHIKDAADASKAAASKAKTEESRAPAKEPAKTETK